MQHISSTFFLFGLLLLLLLAHSAEAQPTTVAQADSLKGLLGSSKPDTNRVHILLKLSDFYLNKTIDPKRDLDSALVLARQAEELGQRLRFTRGLEGAYFLKGQIYIRQQHPGTLLGMLESLSDTNRIKLFLELGQYYLRPSYTQDTHSDSVLFFFRKAESLSKAIGNRKWQEESRLQIGSFYLEQDDLSQGKPYFMHVIESRQKAKDKAGEGIARIRMAANTVCEDELCAAEMRDYNAQALTISRQLKDNSQEAIILLAIGHTYLLEGNPKEAEHFILQGLAIQ